MKSIKSLWAIYSRLIPPVASKREIAEIKEAFYGGVVSILSQIHTTPHPTDEEFADIESGWFRELQEFLDSKDDK